MHPSQTIRKAVIPAAGLGTRFLPTTKAVPKELLPLFDKPLVQYAAEEAAASGISEIILVISPGKESLLGYFQRDPALERFLEARGDIELLEQMRRTSDMVRVSHVVQEAPLGLGHAVLTAREAVGDEPFAVMLPDDVIRGPEPALSQMMKVQREHGGGVVAVEAVPPEQVSAYGVITPEPVAERVYRVLALVEKPPQDEAPSNLAIVGRYLLQPQIFDCLERTTPGAKGEIQITDGMSLMLEEEEVYAFQFLGVRHDGGTPLGLLKASLAVALEDPETRGAAAEMIEQLRPR